MAGLCKTSLTATAVRCAELSDAAIAVIISTGNAIDFCLLSDAMKSQPQLTWLRKGSPVPKGTVTAQLNANPGNVTRGERLANEIEPSRLAGRNQVGDYDRRGRGPRPVWEDADVLSSEKIGEEPDYDEDDENEDDLAERWTPRFRR